MITLHATSKRYSDGFVPMVTLRGAKGQMLGCKCPQGTYREYRTFTNPCDAEDEARLIALRCATQFPGILRVAI